MELERTPIYEIFDRKQSGNQLYIMREDLLPFSLGGNKVRIANAFFEDMQKKGCDIMLIKLETELAKLNDIKKFIEELRVSL